MRRPFLLVVLLAFAALLLATIPTGVQFGDRAGPEVGWRWAEQAVWRTSGHTRATLGGITVRDKDSVRETSYACDVEVAAVEQGRASGLRLDFDEASISEDGEAEGLGLAGDAFRATGLGDDRSFVRDDGKRPKRRARRFLEQQFADPGDDGDPVALLFPDAPVQVGDTWSPNLDAFVDSLGRERFVLDEAASSAVATLTAVTDRDGRAFGTIAFEVVIVPSAITDGTFTEARMAIAGTVDLPLDGDSPDQMLAVTVDIRFLGKVRRKAVTVNLDLDLQTVGSVRLASR